MAVNNSIIADRGSAGIQAMLYGHPAIRIIQAAQQDSNDVIAVATHPTKRPPQARRQHVAFELGTDATSWTATADYLVIVSSPDDVYAQWFPLWARATGGTHAAAPDTTAQGVSVAQLRVDRLASIQAAFGLPIQTLADVLATSRAQVYKWLDASNDVTLQDSSQQRLVMIDRLATRWRELSSTPLSRVAREPLANGGTVQQLLSAALIEEAAVESAFHELAERLAGGPKTETQRMIEAGYTRRPSRRALPSDE